PGEVTPVQFLDLINSRLLYQGYTLVSKDNDLILFNLKLNPLSAEYLTKVDATTIDNHGKFEFVAYLLPLENRNQEQVLQAIQEFKGTYNKIIKGLPGNSILIIDTVANIKNLETVAMGVHNPPTPKAPEKPLPPPPPPESKWDSYILTQNDPEKVEEILATFVSVKGIREGNTLMYFVTDDQHASIRSFIDIIEMGASERPKPELGVYSMEGLTDTSPQQLWLKARMSAWGMYTDPSANFGEAVIELVKKIAPDCAVAPNQVSNKIIVFARPDDHVKIKELFEKLRSGPDPELAPVVKMYSFTNPEKMIEMNEEFSKLMETLVPTATFSFDAKKRQLLVLAIAREHELIAQTLKEIETQSLDTENKRIVMYPVTAKQVERFNLLFNQIRNEPEYRDIIELTDGRLNQLTIFATPTQHERVRALLNEIANLGVAAITSGVNSINGSAVSADAENENGNTNDTNGAAGDTAGGANTANGFATGAGRMNVESIPLRNANNYSVQQLLINMVPGAEISVDFRTNALFVYGTPEVVAAVKKVVEDLDAGLDTEVKFYSLAKELPGSVLDSMDSIAPRARVIFDQKRMQLIIYGSKRDITRIGNVIDAIIAEDTETTDTIRTVSVTHNLPNEILDFVRKVFPRAEIKFDQDTRQVTVMAPESEQTRIAKLIIEAESTLPPEEETRFHTVQQPVTENLITLIREITKPVGQIGDIKRDDTNPKILMVKARPNVQQKVAELLRDKTILEQTSVVPNELRSFPMTPEVRSRFDAVRDDFVKQNGNFKTLNENRKDILSVWATPAQIKQLDLVLQELGKELTPELAEKMLVYTLKYTDLETIQPLIEEVYPGTKISEDKNNRGRLIVRVRPQFHTGVQDMLKQLDTRDPDALKRYFMAYDVNGVTTVNSSWEYSSPVTFIRDLEKLVSPQAKISFDRMTQQVIVWGTDEDHKIIEEAIGNLQKDTDKIKGFEVFPLRRTRADTIITMIHRLYPLLNPRYDWGTQSIIVEGGEYQLKQVKALIEKIDPAEPGPFDPVVQFYKLKSKPDSTL
ncbi:MAG: secretin N-terminal domain-containing protein, partial [Thermoguttaceae bacterium]